MKVQKILPTSKTNNFIKTAIVATALTLAPLTIANAQNINLKEKQKDTIELSQEAMPLAKKIFILFASAIGTVGTALLCAWEPDNKKNPKS